MEREVWIGAVPSCNEMIFCHLDRSFGCIASVVVGWYQLVVNVFLLEELFQDVAAFVIKALQFGSASPSDQASMDGLETCEDGFSFAVFQWFKEDGIAVVTMYHEEVVVSLTGRCG